MEEEMKRLNYLSIKYPKYKKYIFDYLSKYGKIKFKNSFNIIDCLIFSIFSYYHFNCLDFNGEISIKDISKKIILDDKYLLSKEYKILLSKLNCPRYSDIKIIKYKEIFSKINEEQFKAYTLKLNEKTIFISFSGTDNSIVGWKENFNMSFKDSVPSQKEAYLYLKEYENTKFSNIYIGGHSKGGNLAIYSSLCQNKDLYKKIKNIFNFDGPGFLNNIKENECFNEIENKVIKIVPEFSMVGTLLNEAFSYYVIKSNGIGIKQHYPFYWKIKNKNFDYIDNNTRTSIAFNLTTKEILNTISSNDRERFVELLYALFDKLDVDTIQQIKLDFSSVVKTIILEINKLNKEDKKFMFNLGKLILKSYFKNSISIKNNDKKIIKSFKNTFYI